MFGSLDALIQINGWHAKIQRNGPLPLRYLQDSWGHGLVPRDGRQAVANGVDCGISADDVRVHPGDCDERRPAATCPGLMCLHKLYAGYISEKRHNVFFMPVVQLNFAYSLDGCTAVTRALRRTPHCHSGSAAAHPRNLTDRRESLTPFDITVIQSFLDMLACHRKNYCKQTDEHSSHNSPDRLLFHFLSLVMSRFDILPCPTVGAPLGRTRTRRASLTAQRGSFLWLGRLQLPWTHRRWSTKVC